MQASSSLHSEKQERVDGWKKRERRMKGEEMECVQVKSRREREGWRRRKNGEWVGGDDERGGTCVQGA